MLKKVMRVYDKNEKYTNTGKCYFLILPEDYSDEDVYANLCSITGMGWQTYTSYMEGSADINESEMFWSEITGYKLHECKIDISRVKVTGNYKLPPELI